MDFTYEGTLVPTRIEYFCFVFHKINRRKTSPKACTITHVYVNSLLTIFIFILDASVEGQYTVQCINRVTGWSRCTTNKWKIKLSSFSSGSLLISRTSVSSFCGQAVPLDTQWNKNIMISAGPRPWDKVGEEGKGLQKKFFQSSKPVRHRVVTMSFSCRESEIVGREFNSEKVLLLYSFISYENSQNSC